MVKEFPDDWAGNALTAHVDVAIGNMMATTVKNSTEYPLLIELDSCYETVIRGLIDPPGFLEGFFLMRSHAAFRAGCMLAMGGHNTETFPIIRNCLEYALYALHVNRNPRLGEVWLRRHESESTEAKVRQEFKHSKIMKTLEEVDSHAFKVAGSLYQRTIDFGGHPNERAITSSMGVKKGEGSHHYMQDYLSGGTMPHRHALKSSAQIGLCALLVLENIFHARFESAGVGDRLIYLKSVL